MRSLIRGLGAYRLVGWLKAGAVGEEDEANWLRSVKKPPGVDAGAVDAGAVDAGAVDAGAVDAGAVDAGAVDVGAVDVGAVDVGAVDSGGVDSGGVDSGGVDCGGVNCGAVDFRTREGSTRGTRGLIQGFSRFPPSFHGSAREGSVRQGWLGRLLKTSELLLPEGV